MNRAVECVFAEYQKELLEHYDVFAIEAGYESRDIQRAESVRPPVILRC